MDPRAHDHPELDDACAALARLAIAVRALCGVGRDVSHLDAPLACVRRRFVAFRRDDVASLVAARSGVAVDVVRRALDRLPITRPER